MMFCELLQSDRQRLSFLNGLIRLENPTAILRLRCKLQQHPHSNAHFSSGAGPPAGARAGWLFLPRPTRLTNPGTPGSNLASCTSIYMINTYRTTPLLPRVYIAEFWPQVPLTEKQGRFLNLTCNYTIYGI